MVNCSSVKPSPWKAKIILCRYLVIRQPLISFTMDMLRIFHIFKFCYTLSHFSVLAFYFKYLKQAKQYLLRYFLCQIFSSIAFKFYLPQNTRIHAQFSQVLCQFITLWPFLLCPDTCALFLSKSSSE